MDRTLTVAPRASISPRWRRLRRVQPTFRLAGWVVLILLFAGVRPAHAYLDPGSGSMLLQLLLGGVAGLAVIGRLVWQRITSLFRSPRSGEGAPGAVSEGGRPENGAD